MIKVDAILAVVLGGLDVVALCWAWQEHQRAKEERRRNRDFMNKAEVWLEQAEGIANTCTGLEEDYKEGKVVSVEEVYGRVNALGFNARALHRGIKSALNWKNRSRNGER